MIRQLWVSLSIAFATLLVIFAVLVLALFFFFTDNRTFLRDVILANIQDSNITEQIVTLYEETGSWDTVITVVGQTINSTLGAQEYPPGIILTDAEGTVIFSSLDAEINYIPNLQARNAVPLLSDGVLIGYIDINMSEWRVDDNAQTLFIDRMRNTIVAIMIIAVGGGIVMGIIVSKNLTAPLEQLTQWAESVKEKHTQQPLQVGGSIEMMTLAETITDMVSALQTSERLRRNLVADVAHELRTPLTVLQGNLYAIIDDVYPCDKSQISALYDQTRILSRLVSDLHDLSQIEAQQTNYLMRRVELDVILADIVETFQAKADEKAIQLRYRLASVHAINGDPDRLQQVFNNLLSNALRYTPSGEVVSIDLSQQDNQIRIDVTNTGATISEEHLPHLFERFYRADAARDRKRGGAGLGLAITRAIVEAHGGNISVVSENDLTQFSVALPIEIAELSTH